MEVIEFRQFFESGRTAPCLTVCDAGDHTVEAVVKFSGACDRGVVNLALEVIAAALAVDLDLPVPEPFLVEWTAEWAAGLPEGMAKERVSKSSPVAFGSRFLTGGYSTWSPESRVLDAEAPQALALLAFDAFIENPDRRREKPNCLVKGDVWVAIDHEAALQGYLILGRIPPWALGGLQTFEQPGFHILCDTLKGRELDLQPVQEAWASLTDDQIDRYAALIPAEWAAAQEAVTRACTHIKAVRDNIGGCIEELRRVLA